MANRRVAVSCRCLRLTSFCCRIRVGSDRGSSNTPEASPGNMRPVWSLLPQSGSSKTPSLARDHPDVEECCATAATYAPRLQTLCARPYGQRRQPLAAQAPRPPDPEHVHLPHRRGCAGNELTGRTGHQALRHGPKHLGGNRTTAGAPNPRCDHRHSPPRPRTTVT
jgi:hypothetical protein